MARSISQRIAFEGDKEMKAQLKAIGAAAKKAFDEVKQGSVEGSAGLKELQAALKQTGLQMQRLGSRAKSFGRSVSLYITTPLVAAGGLAVRAFANFEEGISNIATLIDTGKESIDKIKQGLLDLSKTLHGVSLTDLAEGMYQVRSAGISAADAFRVLSDAGKLALAGRGSVTEAVDILTSSINAFGLKGEDASKAANSLFLAVKNGKTTVQQLSDGFGQAAAIMKTSGIQLNEFLAATSALTTSGPKAADAYAMLRSVLVGLATKTAEAADIFKELGVDSFGELIKQTGGLVPALKKLHGVVSDDNTAFLKAVGGGRAWAGAMALVGASSEAYVAALAEMNKDTGSLEQKYAEASTRLNAQFTDLGNALQRLGIAFGDSLAPAISLAVKAISAAADWFAGLPGPIRTVLAFVLTLTAAAGPLAFAFGAIASSAGTLIAAIAGLPGLITTLLTAFKSWQAIMLTVRTGASGIMLALGGWPGLITAGVIVALVALGTAIYENWDAVKAWAKGFGEAISSVGEFFKGLYDSAVKYLQPIIDIAKQIVSGLTGASGAAQASTTSTPGKAGGGMIFGAGTSTSDSILARLSNGEFVQRAAAVRYYGADFMRAINRMAIPKGTLRGLAGFASGGLVEALSPLGRLPAFADGGLAEAAVNSQRPVTIQIGAESISGFTADGDAFDRIRKLATRKTIQSGGVKPSWFYR